MPAFGDPMDEKAQAILQELFPTRKVVAIPARDILIGGGNIHCVTQQIPQIKQALGIAGVRTAVSSWFQRGDEKQEGAQVDITYGLATSKHSGKVQRVVVADDLFA